MIDIIPYKQELKNDWDHFVLNSVNNHFMFQRDYMDYHNDRFDEQSFMIYKNDQLIGVFPGSSHKNHQWCSHGGLTFGGLILSTKSNRISLIADIYLAFFKYLKELGFNSALIKPIPWIYHLAPCEGELYVLEQFEKLEQYTELTTTVDLRVDIKFSTLRKRQQKKAIKCGLQVYQDDNFQSFWDILSSKLEDKYEKEPVHSLNEIEMLASRFPKNIFLYRVVDSENTCVGGCIIFATQTTWHAQYISSNEAGMTTGALDLLFMHLINSAKNEGKFYFNFGISTEDNGAVLNTALALFKEGFGGRSLIHRKLNLSLLSEGGVNEVRYAAK